MTFRTQDSPASDQRAQADVHPGDSMAVPCPRYANEQTEHPQRVSGLASRKRKSHGRYQADAQTSVYHKRSLNDQMKEGVGAEALISAVAAITAYDHCLEVPSQ